MDDVEKSALGKRFNPTTQTAKNVGFIVRCEECQKPRLVHSKLKLKKEDTHGAQRMLKKLSYMCGASPAEYVGTGYRDEKFLAIYF